MLYAWSKLKRQSVYKRKLINTSGEITGFFAAFQGILYYANVRSY